MESAKRIIRDFLNANGAKKALSGNGYLWPSKRGLFALSALKDVRIVMRLAEGKGPRKGQMSIIVHSCHELSDSINMGIANALRSIPGFVEDGNGNRGENQEYGVVGRFYFPAQYTWKNLDAATLNAILDQYNVVSNALFNGGFYK